MPFEIVRNDITKMNVDAIVNAANTALQMGGGVCGAIFKAAGILELQRECDEIGKCPTGQAVITKGYKLPSKHIIHTVGPVWRGGESGEAALLHSCYINSFKLAKENNCVSIAFPLISSGIYGYPKKAALQIATSAICDFLSENEMNVYLAVFDKTAFSLSEELLGAVLPFIDEHYVDTHTVHRRQLLDVELTTLEEAMYEPYPIHRKLMELGGLDDIVGNLDESFSQTLFRLIDAKDKTDVEVYKRANIDRKLFSKIRSNKAYMPSKKTALAFAIALELNINETEDLLERAGYTLSHSQKFDVIIEYFITKGIYNIFEINEALFYFDQPLLGA